MYKFLLLLALLLPNLIFANDPLFLVKTEEDKEKVNQIVRQSIANIDSALKEKGWIEVPLEGGVGKDFDKIYLEWGILHTLSQNQARTFLLGCENMVLKMLNKDKLIRPFLSSYPIIKEDIYLEFFYFSEKMLEKNRDPNSRPKMLLDSAISQENGITYYSISFKKDGNFGSTYKEKGRESYAEAHRLNEKHLKSLSKNERKELSPFAEKI